MPRILWGSKADSHISKGLKEADTVLRLFIFVGDCSKNLLAKQLIVQLQAENIKDRPSKVQSLHFHPIFSVFKFQC